MLKLLHFVILDIYVFCDILNKWYHESTYFKENAQIIDNLEMCIFQLKHTTSIKHPQTNLNSQVKLKKNKVEVVHRV